MPFRIGARAALVVAALLQLAGAAGGPWAHTHGRQLASGPQLCAADHQGAHHGHAVHDERWCGVWQALG
ncbi:MAG TPA: hypothetical protein VGR37_14240, partial [Longimicrobiaceae bacterium]|nr:hypothetical protein [Longimicrobiaceae bacterium]